MGWVVSVVDKKPGLKDRVNSWFVDREFFMRANGQVKFLKFSAKAQRRVALTAVGIVGVWGVITAGMAINQASISVERMAINSKEAKIQSAEERVAKYRDSINDVTQDLQKRQDLLDGLAENFGEEAKEAASETDGSKAAIKAEKISKAMPEFSALAKIEARQIIFAEKLTRIAEMRAKKAEQRIRDFGLNPSMLTGDNREAQGGPFIPFFGKKANPNIADPRFGRLAKAFDRMKRLEASLASIPTSMPAAVMNMSSNYGYRRDPITGGGAMHNGIDFKGPHATPILSAAAGTVTHAGWQGGYGKTIEITHANGLITRYAHLSGFEVSLGQKVKRGVKIGRMGSTGRSTGTHLHFEVRLNGQAVNPMKFLEKNADVLEVKTSKRNGINAESTAEAK